MSDSNINEENIEIEEIKYEVKKMTCIKSKIIDFTYDKAFVIEEGKVRKGDNVFPLTPDFSSDYNYNEDVNSCVDVNIKNIYSHWDSLIQVINQHAIIINNEKVKNNGEYITKGEYEHFIDKLEASININTSEKLEKKLDLNKKELFDTNTKDELENKKNSLCNKINKLGNINSFLANNNIHLNKKIKKLKKDFEKKLKKKTDFDVLNLNLNELENKINKKLEKELNEININSKKSEINIKNKFDNLDKQLKNLDKNLKAQLNDCFQLLNLRVSDQKLDDSLNVLEEKIIRIINKLKLENKDSLENINKSIENNLISEIDLFNDKIDKLDLNIKNIYEDLNNYSTKNNFEDLEQFLNDKSDSLFLKIKDITKKYDPMFGKIDLLTKNLSNFNLLEDKWLDLETNFYSLKEKFGNDIEEIKNTPAPMMEQKLEIPHIPQIDENEFEEIKFWTKKLKNNINDINTTLNLVNKNISNKVDNSLFERLLEKKIDKDDVYILMEKFTVEDDRHNNLKKEVKELNIIIQKFMEKTSRKFKKLTNDLDWASIQKLLKSKADDNEIKREFENFDSRYNFLNDLVGCMKKDLDGIFNNLGKITDVISLLQQEQAHALASTKTTMCLSCGRGDANFLPSKPYIEGNDGKVYPGIHKINKNNYDIGYNVFDKKEIVKEHDNQTHKRIKESNFKNSLKNRPITAIPNIKKNNIKKQPINLNIKKL